MNCNNCGNKVDDSNTFCNKCSFKLDKIKTETINNIVVDKGARLTKKQSVTILLISLFIWFVSVSSVNSIILNSIATISFIFSACSLLTKNGLRWR